MVYVQITSDTLKHYLYVFKQQSHTDRHLDITHLDILVDYRRNSYVDMLLLRYS